MQMSTRKFKEKTVTGSKIHMWPRYSLIHQNPTVLHYEHPKHARTPKFLDLSELPLERIKLRWYHRTINWLYHKTTWINNISKRYTVWGKLITDSLSTVFPIIFQLHQEIFKNYLSLTITTTKKMIGVFHHYHTRIYSTLKERSPNWKQQYKYM